MAKVLPFFLVLTICISLQTAYAASFECSDEPAVCKTKFGQQYEKDFKELHVEAMRKFFTTYNDKIKIIKGELSPNDPYVEKLDGFIDILGKSLQKVNDNINDPKKIDEAFEEVANGMNWAPNNAPETDTLKKLLEKHHVREAIVDILRKIGTDAGNLWANMYSGLRETDLKTYPEYAEVNEHMEALRVKPKAGDYNSAAEILGDKFDLSYFKIINYIS